MSRQGGEQWSCYFFARNSLTTSEVCAGALSWCNNQSPFFTSQAVCASHFPSVVSKPRNKIPHLQSDQVEQTPYAQFLECKKDQHLLDVAANLAGFFGRGENGVFHCEDFCFVSGS